MYARTSRYVNREGCGPKLKEILKIFLSENPVNFGSSHSGRSYAGGLDPDEYAKTLDTAYAVACCFSSRENVRNVLAKLKKADTGISIVVSGLVEEIRKMGDEVGLKPHTALLSLGVHGRKELLPKESVLEITTMCGHGLVATHLVQEVAAEVRTGTMTPEDGAHLLAQPCPCGIFNLDRCVELLKEELEKLNQEGGEKG
jgi:hypothetical protein